MTIDDLGLSVRSYNLLRCKEIYDVEVLLNMTNEEIIGLHPQKAMGEIIMKLEPLRKARQEAK
ncbi:hypothetical protein AGMMS49983_15550 [Clostridia bacterium]|nr:hypothetical protein AGMMS49983_15550 [Clostridia bacterium]